MPLKKVRNLIWLLAGAEAVSIALMALSPHELFLIPIVGIALGIIALSIRFWRCPHCKKHLPQEAGGYCTFCGKELDL